MVSSKLLTFALLLICFLGFSSRASAQVLYGTLLGNVTDPSSSGVPAVRVVVTNTATGQNREMRTDERGFYAFRDLQQGTYRVLVTASGFAPIEHSAVDVSINTAVRLDLSLSVANVSETVSVSASAGLLQTDRANLHSEITTSQITKLPLSGYRNYQSLLNLVPGATPARFQNAQTDSPARSLTTNINGTSRNTNNTRIDGATSVFPYLPHHTLYVPPAESIEMVNIATNSFDAEQGMAGGAAINVITKAGTNDLHGVLFAYHNNNAMASRNFFYLGAQRPKNIQNQYGGTIGGPIRKDRLFYFGSYEAMRQRQNFSSILTVPTAAQRIGDFSGLGVTLYDPLTGTSDGRNRTAFPEARIPLCRQSAISRKLQALIPDANRPGIANNFFASAPVVFDRHNGDAKVNWNVSERSSLWGKYSMMEATVVGQPSLGAAGGAGLLNGGRMGTGHTLVQVIGTGYTKTFTPTLILDTNFGFSRLGQNVKGPDYGTNFGLDVLGIPGTNGADVRESGQPIFRIPGYETLGNSDGWSPVFRNDNVFTYVANMAWTKGAHNMRFGIDVSNTQMSDWQPQRGQGPRGGFEFAGGTTGLNGGPARNQLNAYAAFLLGLPSVYGKSFQYLSPMTVKEWSLGLYFRDQWQATRNLTLTLGARWEYYPIIGRGNGRGIERYDAATNKVYIGGVGDVPKNAGTTASPYQFAPRLGIAYRLGSGTVIRSGFGISVDPYPLSRPMRDPYPVTVAQDFRAANAFVPERRLEDGIPPLTPIDFGNGIIDIPLDAYTKTLLPGRFKRGYVESFNLMVQRQLPGNFSLQAGYVGTRTIRQTLFRELNAGLVEGAGAAGQPLAVKFGRRAQTQSHEPFRTANYNALQVRLDRRFSAGLQITTSYTWSKRIDWSSDSDSGLLFNLPSGENRNRAVSNFDRTQVLQSGVVAELPFGKGKRWVGDGGVTAALLGGWQINGIFSAYTGRPFTVTASAASLNAPFNTQVADQVLPQVTKFGGVGTGEPYFDPKAFAPVTEARLGTSGRNAMRGPGAVNLDSSVFRNFALRERFNLQFRAEAFNTTNTPHFNNPSSSVNAASFGYINSAADDQRVVRVALRLSF